MTKTLKICLPILLTLIVYLSPSRAYAYSAPWISTYPSDCVRSTTYTLRNIYWNTLWNSQGVEIGLDARQISDYSNFSASRTINNTYPMTSWYTTPDHTTSYTSNTMYSDWEPVDPTISRNTSFGAFTWSTYVTPQYLLSTGITYYIRYGVWDWSSNQLVWSTAGSFVRNLCPTPTATLAATNTPVPPTATPTPRSPQISSTSLKVFNADTPTFTGTYGISGRYLSDNGSNWLNRINISLDGITQGDSSIMGNL